MKPLNFHAPKLRDAAGAPARHAVTKIVNKDCHGASGVEGNICFVSWGYRNSQSAKTSDTNIVHFRLYLGQGLWCIHVGLFKIRAPRLRICEWFPRPINSRQRHRIYFAYLSRTTSSNQASGAVSNPPSASKSSAKGRNFTAELFARTRHNSADNPLLDKERPQESPQNQQRKDLIDHVERQR